MAEGTLILRPSADIYVEHVLYPSDSTFAYLLINEEESDGFSTYIRSKPVSALTASEISSTSKFRLSNTSAVGDKPFFVTSVMVFGTSYCSQTEYARNSFTLEINGVAVKSDGVDEDYKGGGWFGGAFYEAIAIINDYLVVNKVLPEINIIVESTSWDATGMGNKVKLAESGVSQLYVTLNYEEILDIGVFRKVNGVVKAATAAYRKLGGSWAEIPEEEAKDILKNNIITQGGS